MISLKSYERDLLNAINQVEALFLECTFNLTSLSDPDDLKLVIGDFQETCLDEMSYLVNKLSKLRKSELSRLLNIKENSFTNQPLRVAAVALMQSYEDILAQDIERAGDEARYFVMEFLEMGVFFASTLLHLEGDELVRSIKMHLETVDIDSFVAWGKERIETTQQYVDDGASYEGIKKTFSNILSFDN